MVSCNFFKTALSLLQIAAGLLSIGPLVLMIPNAGNENINRERFNFILATSVLALIWTIYFIIQSFVGMRNVGNIELSYALQATGIVCMLVLSLVCAGLASDTAVRHDKQMKIIKSPDPNPYEILDEKLCPVLNEEYRQEPDHDDDHSIYYNKLLTDHMDGRDRMISSTLLSFAMFFLYLNAFLNLRRKTRAHLQSSNI